MNIRDRILARQDLDSLRAVRDIDALAAALNAEGFKTIQPRFITGRVILTRCPSGRDILNALETAAPTNTAAGWALKFLSQEAGLDIGDPGAQGMMAQFVASGLFQQAWVDQLTSLALQPVIVTRDQVNAAMFNPDGSEK